MKTETLLELLENREFIIKRISMRYDNLRIILRRGMSNLVVVKSVSNGYCKISLNTYQDFNLADSLKIAKKLKPLIHDMVKIEF